MNAFEADIQDRIVSLTLEIEKLKIRNKELEQACINEAMEKNIVKNIYEITRKKLREVFLVPTLINDIREKTYEEVGDDLLIKIYIPITAVKERKNNE